MDTKELLERYHSSKATCCKCGCTLEDANGELGSVFVMDYDGNFYCSNCDEDFEDGDERIFEAEFFEDDYDMQLEKKIVGTKYFSGEIDATDPCYDDDVWCRVNNIPIVSGDYECVAWIDIDSGRPMICGIYLIGAYGEVDYHNSHDFEHIGDAGVDAGLCGFFQNKPNYNDDEWGTFCNNIGMANESIIDCGFFTSSGFGDGCYEVVGVKEDDGKFSALEIRF